MNSIFVSVLIIFYIFNWVPAAFLMLVFEKCVYNQLDSYFLFEYYIFLLTM